MTSTWASSEKRFRAAAAAIVALMASVIILIIWHLYSTQQAERSLALGDTEKRASQLAHAASDRLGVSVRNIDFLLQSARRDYLTDRKRFDSLAKSLLNTFSPNDFLQLVIADEKGDVAYSALGLPTGPVNVAQREYFKVFQSSGEDHLYVTAPFKSRISQKWIVLFVRPVLRDGKFAGVVTLSMTPEQITAMVTTLALDQNDIIAVFDTEGHYVARTTLLQQVLGKALSPPRPFMRPDAPQRGIFHITAFADGADRVYGWERVPGAPLVAVTGIDRVEALASVNRHVTQNWINGGVVCVFVFAFGGGILLLLYRLARQQASVALSEARFRQLTGLSSDWYWEQDTEFRYTFLSKEIEQHVSVKAEELIGSRRWDRKSNLTDAEWAAHRAVVERHEPFRDLVYMRRTRDGSQRWVLASGDPVFDSAGKFQGYRGIGRNITGQMQAAQALEEQRQQMAKIIEAFNHLDSGMVLYGPDDRLIFCNQRFREIYKEVADLLVPGVPYADIARGFYQRGFDNEAALDEETYVKQRIDRHLDPGEHDYEYFLEPDTWLLVSDRKTADGGVIGFRLDITARKHAEAEKEKLESQLRQSQKLETVGTLAAGIAHDFNNILTAIIGNVEFAIEDLPPEHRAQTSLGEIRRASHRARDLVRQILAFSQQHAPERHVVDLGEVVDETVRMLRAAMPAGIELAVHHGTQGPHVEADRAQIMQVLVNLCTNAWHAIGGAVGRIEIDVTPHTADDAGNGPKLPPGHYARLSVKDTGSGMDDAVLRRIFDPFFTTKAPGEGTGLGLAVVHGIVAGHDGIIDVQSKRGVGTTFSLYFPAVEENRRAEDELRPISPRGAAQHILYVDDDDLLVLLIETLLKRLGYRVTAHNRVDDALATLAEPNDIELVVTDYNMPGKSGLDFAKELKQTRPELPIVLTSGYVTDELREEALALGIKAVLYKPNTMDELALQIHRIFAEMEQA